MDYYQSWDCEAETEDLFYHQCQLTVNYMSGCLYLDSAMLCPIQDARIVVQDNSEG